LRSKLRQSFSSNHDEEIFNFEIFLQKITNHDGELVFHHAVNVKYKQFEKIRILQLWVSDYDYSGTRQTTKNE